MWQQTSNRAPTPTYIRITWALLLLLGALFLIAALADLSSDLRIGIPSDHLPAFMTVTGTAWENTRRASPGVGRYITLLEIGYAVHELVLGVLFLAVVAIPLRRGERWAWWTCWAVMLANLTYSLTFGRYDPTILARSLVADLALPVLLLVYLPFLFRRSV